LAVFQKKLGTKHLDTTKKIWLYCFLLSFGPRVHFQGKKLIFWQKKSALNTIFSQKLSNYHISLWRKVFFSYLINFFFMNIKAAHSCEGSPKTIRTRSLIGNMVFGSFPKIIMNKTLYFDTTKKIWLYSFFT
jgi:hypothetical protein